ncbi:MAG: cation:proton antiporter [Thermococcus sp.]|nr:cation:proton antiporter [Thermococcus sp.]
MQVGIVPIIPLGFAFFLPFIAFLTGRKRGVIIAYSLVALSATFLAGLWLFDAVYSRGEPLVYAFGNWIAPIGIVFEVDLMGSLLVLLTSFMFLMAGLYAVEYLSHDHGIEFFYTSLLGLEAGLIGLFMTGDAFNTFVMLEVTGASAYALVGFYRSRSEAVEGAFKYGISGATATTLYFLALGFIYASFGTLNMADLSAKFHGISFPVTTKLFGDPTLALGIFFALTLAMVMIKSAIFPGHYWLPYAHSAAPSPVSALLSGLVVSGGVYLLARYLYTVFYGLPFWKTLSVVLLALGAASALLSSIMMVVQKDVKRLVAYSTILHMGYLIMGLGVGTQLALTAVLYHTVNHAIAKGMLFLSVGAFIHHAGTRKIDELAGVGREMPLTTALFALATLSLIGVPPLNVFFSKMLIFNALLQVSPLAASVVVITSAIAAWAYFGLFVTLWRGKPVEGHHHGHKEHEGEEPERHDVLLFVAVNLILGILVVILGVLAPVIIDKFFNPAAVQAMDYQGYIGAVLNYSKVVFG